MFYGNNMQGGGGAAVAGARGDMCPALTPAVTVRSIHHLRTHWRRGRAQHLLKRDHYFSVSQLTVGYAMHRQQREGLLLPQNEAILGLL